MAGQASEVGQPQATLFLPAQGAAPIPVAGTTSAAAAYCDGTNLMLSVNGGAYAAIATGATGVTLDGAYDFGGAGAGRTITVDSGAVQLNGATAGASTILSITQTVASNNTGTITGLAINMSAAGTAATPATVNLPALTIVGAHSSVAKARGSGLVTIVSGYRNATAISCLVRNKQALAGSLVMLGWDSTNYEGFPATSSILTDVTHMVTLDGQTNVDAATNNVSFVGLRVLVPQTSLGTSRGISVASNQSAGSLVSVAAGNGAITATSSLTGVNVDFSSMLGGAVECTPCSAIGAQDSSSTSSCYYGNYRSNAGSRGIIYLDTTISGLTGSLTGIAVDLSGTTAGSLATLGVSVTIPASTSTSTRGVSVSTLQKAGALFSGSFSAATLSGTLTGMSLDCATNVTGGSQQVKGLYVATGSSVATSSYAGYFSWGSLGGTASGNGVVNINTNVNGTTTGALTLLEIGADTASLTLGAALTGINVNLSTNVTPGSNTVTGISVSIPATTGTSDGISVLSNATGLASHAISASVSTNTPMSGGVSGDGTAIYVTRNGNTTVNGSESQPVVKIISSVQSSSNTLTLSHRILSVLSISLPTGGTTNWTGSVVYFSNEPILLGGTMSLSGAVCTINHAPTISSGTISADTTTGLKITMTPTAASAVTGVSITMSANATGKGLLLTYSGTAATNAATFTSAQTSGTILQVTGTGNPSGNIFGQQIDLSGLTANGQRVRGLLVTLGANTATNTYPIEVQTTQTSGSAIFANMTGTISASGGSVLALSAFNSTPGANPISGIYIALPATTYANTSGYDLFAGIVLDNHAVSQSAIQIVNYQTSGSVFTIANPADFTLAGNLLGISIDHSRFTAGLTNRVQGISIAIPATSHATAAGITIASTQTAGNGINLALTGTLSAAQTGINVTWSGSTPGGNVVQGVAVTMPATSATTSYGVFVSSTQKAGAMFRATATGTITSKLYGALLDLAGVTAGGVDVTGVHVSVPSGASTASRGIYLLVSTTAMHQFEFNAVTDGTYMHILGPSAGQLRIGAGTPASAGAGREIALVASDAGGTSGGAGGSIYLQEGAGNGGGARGQIAIGQNANMRLGFFAGGPATQQTPTGSRGGNAALASLLTALAAYGLIVDGTSA